MLFGILFSASGGGHDRKRLRSTDIVQIKTEFPGSQQKQMNAFHQKCVYVHQQKQLLALILQLGVIKALQKGFKRAAVKPQTTTLCYTS